MNDQKLPIAKNEENDRSLQPHKPTPLEIAGEVANRVAGQHIFGRYLNEKSVNTVKRHARDLELFAEYLIDIDIPLKDGADFQTNPDAWRGVTWGIVEGFVQWLLYEGYAIASVNARLSTVRTYAQMAVKAGSIDRQEGLLIQSVKGFSRQGGVNMDERREKTRIGEISYAYKPEGRRQSIVVTRRSTKKQEPSPIEEEFASLLKQPRNDSPQAYRDAFIGCLLLDHGLRASELSILKASDFDLDLGKMTFYRPKIKGTEHEWTTHQLTPVTLEIATQYFRHHYPPTLLPDGPAILTTTRYLMNGTGGLLQKRAMNRVRISERVAWLGKQLGMAKLSAHDCRHYCATKMARLGYGIDELMAWFGWTSAQTAVRYVASVDVKERYKG